MNVDALTLSMPQFFAAVSVLGTVLGSAAWLIWTAAAKRLDEVEKAQRQRDARVVAVIEGVRDKLNELQLELRTDYATRAAHERLAEIVQDHAVRLTRLETTAEAER